MGQSRTIGRAAKIGWEKSLSRKWYPRFLSVKSLIGRFYWEETGDRRIIADPAARIRFYLHKEFRAAEIWFSLHKEFRDGEIIGGRCVRKWRFSKRETAFAGYKFFRNGEIIGGDARFFKWKKASIHWKIFPLRGRNGQILTGLIRMKFPRCAG